MKVLLHRKTLNLSVNGEKTGVAIVRQITIPGKIITIVSGHGNSVGLDRKRSLTFPQHELVATPQLSKKDEQLFRDFAKLGEEVSTRLREIFAAHPPKEIILG